MAHYSHSTDASPKRPAFHHAIAVGCVAFNEAQLVTMTTVVDQVCVQIGIGAAPQEREFVAWLVVRLAQNGICDPVQIKQAALEAMRPRTRRLTS